MGGFDYSAPSEVMIKHKINTYFILITVQLLLKLAQ